MNRLPIQERARLIGLLAEGASVRAASRICDVSINTVSKLLVDVGTAASEYERRVLVNLPCKRIQCDEIWAFCYAKQKNLPVDKQGIFGYGDVWTWTALCAVTKLVPSWRVGTRGAETAYEFIQDLSERLAHRIQLTTDGHRVYLDAVESAFGSEVDYAMLVKLYGADRGESESRYSPAECIGCRAIPISGRPNAKHISTSFVERRNLTMRMGMRRFTRLMNAFSKKVENHIAAVAVHFIHYNFARIHKTLRVTPAMAAGVSEHVWELEEIARLAN